MIVIGSMISLGYYLPVITSIVAIAVVWRFLLNPDIGLINLVPLPPFDGGHVVQGLLPPADRLERDQPAADEHLGLDVPDGARSLF